MIVFPKGWALDSVGRFEQFLTEFWDAAAAGDTRSMTPENITSSRCVS
ncbi:MAG TPA: hypothetical protein VIJ64_01630 [Candidatus Lustribacter sp.]